MGSSWEKVYIPQAWQHRQDINLLTAMMLFTDMTQMTL